MEKENEMETTLKEMVDLVEVYKLAFHKLAYDYHSKTPCLFELNLDRDCGDCVECVEGRYLLEARKAYDITKV